MSLSGTVGDAKGDAEGAGVAGGEAGVAAAGGAGLEAEEGAEAEGDSLLCVLCWTCVAMCFVLEMYGYVIQTALGSDISSHNGPTHD